MTPLVAARIEAIKRHWVMGCSASDLAAVVGGTRNAIIGVYGRNREALKDYPLRAPSEKKRARAAASLRVSQEKVSPRVGHLKPQVMASAEPAIEADPVVIEPAPDEPASLNLGLTDLTSTTCKWPHGDPKEPGFAFCGHRTVEGKAWCPHHMARATTKGTQSERSAVRDARSFAKWEAAE